MANNKDIQKGGLPERVTEGEKQGVEARKVAPGTDITSAAGALEQVPLVNPQTAREGDPSFGDTRNPLMPRDSGFEDPLPATSRERALNRSQHVTSVADALADEMNDDPAALLQLAEQLKRRAGLAGKTATGQYVAKTVLVLSDPDGNRKRVRPGETVSLKAEDIEHFTKEGAIEPEYA